MPKIADEFVTETSTDTDEDGCTPHDLSVIIIDLLRQYVWCPNEHVYLIAALWILHTHCYRQFRHTTIDHLWPVVPIR
jgi:hypothetical protein